MAKLNIVNGESGASVRAKLNTVDDGATDDQTGAEIKAAYEAELDTNAFTDAEQTKLAGIESGATADQTGAEIKLAYELEPDTNAFTDLDVLHLSGIEPGATADQTGAEIKVAYESQLNTNAFTDAEQTKLAGIGAGADALTANPLSQFAATTSAQLAGVISDETGTGLLCFATSPTLTTPDIGVATATSVNKLAITAPLTSATLTVADGATLTASATADVSGTNTGDQTITLTGDVTGSGTGSFAATIADEAVTLAKMAHITTDSFLGRDTVGTGDVEVLTPAAARTILNVADGANNYSHPNHTGDVTSTGDGATTIGNNVVTYAKMQDVTATDRLLGRSTIGAGDVEEITCTAAGRAILDDADASAQRTTLGLGSIATQASASVSITGGTITGITDVAIADGGTGASTAQAAIDALTQVSGATNEHVLTKDTATGNAIFKAAAGGGGSPGGSDTQIQYNNGGAFGGMAGITWDDVTNELLMEAQAADDTVLNLKMASGQTANIFEVRNSADSVLTRVDSDGDILARDLLATRSVWLGVGQTLSLKSGSSPHLQSTEAGAQTDTLIISGSTDKAFVFTGPYIGAAVNWGHTALTNPTVFVHSNTSYVTATDEWIGISHDVTDGVISVGSGLIANRLSDATTNTVVNVMSVDHNGGTVTNGFGGGLVFRLETSTTENQDAALIEALWDNATHASRSADLVLSAYNQTTKREGVRIRGGSSAVEVGFFAATPVVQPSGTGEATGFTAGAGTGVNDDSTFTGNVGSTAYRISDIVKALKNLGLLAQ